VAMALDGPPVTGANGWLRPVDVGPALVLRARF
jgi:hypothetical protein